MRKRSSNSSNHHSGNTVVLVAKEIQPGYGETDAQYLEIINLRHPRSNNVAKFIYNSRENTVFELLKFSQPYRSWFIGNYVCSNGDLYLSTSIDPLFLVLPYFYKAEMSSTIDQLVHDDDFKDAMKLEAFFTDNDQLSLIAKKKDCGGFIVWKYDEERTLFWLAHKIRRLSAMLENKCVNVNTSCAVSSSFVKSTKDSPESYLRYAHGLVSDYLMPDLSEKVSSFLKIPPLEANPKKRKNLLNAEDIKRIKIECKEKEVIEVEMKREKTPAKKSTKQVALAKAAAGSKSISSFFKKK